MKYRPFPYLLCLPMLLLNLILTPDCSHAQAEEPISADSLASLVSQANESWSTGQSNLNLAVHLLSEVSRSSTHPYYDLATTFYFWSVRNADFARDEKIIQEETARILPLLSDSAATHWEQLLANGDDRLLKEIYGFWEQQDPYVSTRANERLLEHWQRIHTAQNKYTRASKEPYGTDDRGIYFIRLGQPDKTITRTIHLNQVMDPSVGMLTFELGHVIQSEVELWIYNEGDRENETFLVFGRSSGFGEYRIHDNLLDLFNSEGVQVDIPRGNFISHTRMRQFSENVMLLGILEQLAPDHPYFDRMYTQMYNRLTGGTSSRLSAVSRYNNNVYFAKPALSHQLNQQIRQAPAEKTDVLDSEEILPTSHTVYRFLTEDNSPEFIFTLETSPSDEHPEGDSYFISNQLFVYDNDWNFIGNIDDPVKLETPTEPLTSMYRLSRENQQNRIYFASELIDTSRSGIFQPDKINPKASAIVAASGKNHLILPEPLDTQDSLLVSDIILGHEQEINDNMRIPVTPSLDLQFEEDARAMIYFEVYNIPPEGYSVEYYFERKRWLLGNTRVRRKPTVTINSDRIGTRHSQVFSIPLSQLNPGSYDLVLQFNKLSGDEPSAPDRQLLKRKRIGIEIVE